MNRVTGKTRDSQTSEWEKERSEVRWWMGREKKNHTYSFTSDWRTSADRDQIEKATYPSPSLPLPLSQLKHRLCWRGHGVPAFQRKQPWGKTSLVLKKTPCKHRLDNDLGKPALSQYITNLSELICLSHKFSHKAGDDFFPQALVHLLCLHRHKKLANPDKAHISLLSSQIRDRNLSSTSQKKRAEDKRLSRDGSSVNFKRQRGEFWGSTTKNGSIINYRHWKYKGGERETVVKTVFSLDCLIFGKGWKSI